MRERILQHEDPTSLITQKNVIIDRQYREYLFEP